ncbi:MAG: permease-like cell division protein FtsX [Balneolaceae bacterium]|nr:permease-like cell division protein FtsX [Balneolaceae bacterium]
MSFSYVVREGISGFKRARLASFTSIFSLFIAVLLIGVLARVSYNAYTIAQELKRSVEVEVFLMDLDRRTTDELKEKFESRELIQNVVYISKDSAATIFKNEFGSGADALAELEFLPASFKLSISPDASAEQVQKLIREITGFRGVEEVRFNRQLMEMLESRFKTFTLAGGGLGLLILLTAVILVFNTIRLTIYAKRGLIKAMKLVGATNSFIRRPFVMEGIIQGVVAGLFAVGIMYLLFQYIIPKYLPGIGILEWPFGRWYYLCGAMLLLSILMAFLGSHWAARKFIRRTSIAES